MAPLWQDVYDSLVERALIPTGASVLDVGAGTGETAIRASKFAGPSGRVIGVDREEQMLGIARRKARALHLGNLEFKEMSFEELALDDRSFDRVIGNYSICCCSSYDDALSECLRVLKPGGTMTFNQSGPFEPLEFQIAFDTFEKYKTKRPSERLRDNRKADIAQKKAVEKYRDPFVTLSAMRKIGFKDVEANISQRTIRYKDVGAFLDRMLAFSWHNEADEMPMESVEGFRAEATNSLKPYSTTAGFLVRDEMITYTGRRSDGGA
ncbi:MAG TPA: methyltransferase domain-containing protein [Nitrososphaerales archaeon]|nr:methyltransferase domain-containing protein [Nitrososphaerales archaeon]